MKLALSHAGAEFIEAWEGFRSRPYNDSRNNTTIGIGHLIHPGPVRLIDREHWGRGLSRSGALTLLQKDVQANALHTLQRTLKVPLTQPQIDALCCLAFNTGPGSIEVGHDVIRAVNSKPKVWRPLAMKKWRQRVEDAFMEWARPSELRRRRQSEVCLFRTGKYTKATGNRFSNE